MPAGDQNKLEAILLCGTEKLIGEDTKIELPLVEQVDASAFSGVCSTLKLRTVTEGVCGRPVKE